MNTTEKEAFIKEFENGERKQTDLSCVQEKGGKTYYYGEPSFDGAGKLQGFAMMTFKKMHDGGHSFRSEDEPYLDEQGKQVFMEVDAYLQFAEKLSEKDPRLLAELEREAKELNNSKLAKLRRKAAEKLGLKDKKIPNKVKKIEKAISDRFLGKSGR